MDRMQELIISTCQMLREDNIGEFVTRIINKRYVLDVLKVHRDLLGSRFERLLGFLEAMSIVTDANTVKCRCFVCTKVRHHNRNVLLLFLSVLQVRIAWEEHGRGKNSQGLAQQLNQIKEMLQEIMPENWFVKGELTPEQISNTAPPYMAIFEEARLNDDLQMRQAVWSISELYSFFSNESEEFVPSEAEVRVLFPMVLETAQGFQTYGFQIVLERINASNLPVAIYPHPASLNSFAAYDTGSIDEMRSVWSAFCEECSPNYAVRWRIMPYPNDKDDLDCKFCQHPVVGNSFGAALAVGLLALHSNQPLDPNCYITGCVKLQLGKSLGEAEIGNVGNINEKIQIIRDNDSARLLIPSSEKGYHKQRKVAPRIRRVKTVQQAREEATEKRRTKDGKEMILVRVGEKQLYVDKYVVTVKEYEKFLREEYGNISKWERPWWAKGKKQYISNLPATYISVREAMDYAKKYGKRLPTIEEVAAFAIVDDRNTEGFIHFHNAPRMENEVMPMPIHKSRSKTPLGIYIFGNVEEYALSDASESHAIVWGCSYKRVYRPPDAEDTTPLPERHRQVCLSPEEYDQYKNICVGFRCVMDRPEKE